MKNQTLSGKVLGIDALRGIAACGVLLVHLSQTFSDSAFFAKTLPVFNLGKHGVAIFFTLSGYLLTKSLWNNRSINLYARRRFLRIYPAYFVCLIALVVIQGTSTSQLMTHLLLIHFVTAATFGGINYPFWSLSVEFVYYLILPLLRTLENKKLRTILNALIALSITWQIVGGIARQIFGFDKDLNFMAFGYPLTGFASFGIGILLATNSLSFWESKITKVIALSFILAEAVFALILVLTGFSTSYNLFETIMHGSIGYLMYGVVTVWLIERLSVKSVPGLLLFSGLGTVSYSLYLWHLPILHWVEELSLPIILRISLALVLIAITSTLSYLGIERVFIRTARKFTGGNQVGR